MLDKEDISLMSILTPPQSHASLAIEALRRGVNVLVEKPLTMTSSEAERIFDALESSTAKLTVNYIWLFTKVMAEALHMIKSGAIGGVLQAEIKVLLTKDDPMASDKNHWCHKVLGGRFGEMLPHPVYALQASLGNEFQVKEVYAEKRGDYYWMPYDELNTVLQDGTGLGHIYVSFNAPRHAILVTVYGTKAVLQMDLVNQTLIVLGPRNAGKVESATDTLSLSWRLATSTMTNAIDFLMLQKGEYPIRSIYNLFIHSIERNTEPPVTPDMAYNTVRIVEEICNKIPPKGL